MADSIPAVRRESARAPVHVRLFGDRIFNTATFILALTILALLFGLAIALIATAFPRFAPSGCISSSAPNGIPSTTSTARCRLSTGPSFHRLSRWRSRCR